MDTYETSIYTAVLITATVLGCSIVYFVVSVYRQQRNYLRHQRLYFTDEINLLEKERSRFAHDLHDELGPILSSMRTLLQQVERSNARDAHHLDKADEYIGRLLKRMKQIAVNLTPSALSKKGLQFALADFFDDLNDVHPLAFHFTYEVTNDIDVGRAIHLYRIVQELAHNTIKHAQARQLYIHFKERKGRLYLFCEDNGSGFAFANPAEKERGMGLSSLQSRTAVLKGTMRLESEPGKGTKYFFEFPFPNQSL